MCKNNESMKSSGERPKKKDHVSIFGHWTLEGKKLKNKSPVLPREEICVEKKGKSAFVNNLRTHAPIRLHSES